MYLMHKNIVVAEVSEDKKHIKNIYNVLHMPIGACDYLNPIPSMLTDKYFTNWNMRRIIPSLRQDVYNIEKTLNMSVSDAYVKSLGVSLTDCYWYKTKESTLTWEDVNFHDNGFALDYLEKKLANGISENLNIPDITTNGNVPKLWVPLDGINSLLKYDFLNDNVSSANEVAASRIADYAGIPHTRYSAIKLDNKIMCSCPCFITDSNTEMVSMLQLSNAGYYNANKLYEWFQENNLLEDVLHKIRLGVAIHDTDCHEMQISYYRDAETLKVLGVVPAYDNGNSFGNYRIYKGKLNPHIKQNSEMKLFGKSIEGQLPYIKYMPEKLLDIRKLKEIVEESYDLFEIPNHYLEIAKSEIDFANYKYLNSKRERDYDQR